MPKIVKNTKTNSKKEIIIKNQKAAERGNQNRQKCPMVASDLAPWLPATIAAWLLATLEIQVSDFRQIPKFGVFSRSELFGLYDFSTI